MNKPIVNIPWIPFLLWRSLVAFLGNDLVSAKTLFDLVTKSKWVWIKEEKNNG